jgi:hypothetical protein
MLRITLFLISLISFTGCTPEVIVKEREDTPLMNAIAKSAQEIHKDLLQLSRIKQLGQHHANFEYRKPPASGPLANKMTLKWVGRPQEAVATVSMLMGFRSPQIVGRVPANQPSITIDAVNKPAHEILEDIGLQMGDSAGLSIGQDRIAILFEGAHE